MRGQGSGDRRQRTEDRGQKTEDRRQKTGFSPGGAAEGSQGWSESSSATPGNWTEVGALAPFPRLVWVFVAIGLLAMPLFAHGCHGDDVDHEPLLIPTRLNPEDR